MKRSLLCPVCAKPTGVNPSKQITELEAAERAREHVSKVYGRSRGSYICDLCGDILAEGSRVCAESIALNQDELSWHWWLDYIRVEER